jgi:GH15 family glucan-1,4-alpha-glucosidase
MSLSRDAPPPIEDYALIGDCKSAALVAKDGSIDWLCWPRFDSAACFAALLGGPENGRYRIAPCAGDAVASRRYLHGTLILETVFETAEGSVALIDFMVPEAQNGTLVRIVEGRSGTVQMRLDLALRFDYGQSVPWVTKRRGGNGIVAVSGPDMVVLRTDVSLLGEEMTTVAEFAVRESERARFVLTHCLSHLPVPFSLDSDDAFYKTDEYWQRWSARCTYKGEWAEQVSRSLLTLKCLTYNVTGGIVAAPTTSLPEELGGVRNWDYRFCWLRDASLTLFAFMRAGYYEEATAWAAWLQRSAAGSPDQVQIMYGIAGERRLEEWEVGWLAGYQGAAPVRIGNAAAKQVQLDIYGEVCGALNQARKGKLLDGDVDWPLERAMLGHLETLWREPDSGLWETRGGEKHFTFGKVMAWVAFARAIEDAEREGLDAPLERWRAIRDEIHATVCAEGFDKEMNSFVQSFGSKNLDATLLLIPVVGFLPGHDPRVEGTIAAIERDLMEDGFVLRYRTDEHDDGLPGREGAFIACSFWLASAMHLQGREDEARALFERLLGLCNDVGLLAEEYDPRAKRFTGNFPQAFSHVALITTALLLGGIRESAT